MSRVYSFKDYDKNICLKPPVEFWLVVVFFLHPYLLKFSTFQRVGGPKTEALSRLYDLAYPDDFGFFLAILATVPVVLLLFAMAKRKPGASQRVRKIWHKGRGLLISASVLNIVVLVLPVLMGRFHTIHMYGIAQLLIAVLIIAYVLRSQRLKDTFADFPADQGAEKGKR